MLGDDALIMSHRLQQWVHARARAGGRGGARQHRARPARPGPAAARPRRAEAERQPGTDEDALRLLPRRAASSATYGWPSGPTATSRDLMARLLVVRDLAAGAAATGWPARRDPVLAAIARQGRQGADLPPRLRGALGGPARRRHRGVAPADAGRARRGVAAGRRAVRAARGRAAPRRGRVAVDPADAARRVRRGAGAGAARRDARTARGAAARRCRPAVRGATACTTEHGRRCCRAAGLARRIPEATW